MSWEPETIDCPACSRGEAAIITENEEFYWRCRDCGCQGPVTARKDAKAEA